MRYYQKDISAFLENSHHLNKKKAEIAHFHHMFISLCRGNVLDRFACMRHISDLQSEVDRTLLIRIHREHKHEHLQVTVVQNGKKLCTLFNAQSLPRNLIIPVWRMLPQLLGWLEETFPEIIKPEIDLYRTAGSSPTGMF